MVYGEGPTHGEKNVGAATAGPLWLSKGSSGLITKGDYVAHCVKGSVVKVGQQGLFLSDPNE